MKKTVIIKFEIEGFHQYDSAPDAVAFLKESHRHTFKITVGYAVTDSNREVEIFLKREEVIEYLHEAYGYPCQFDGMSCEMIAEDILEFVKEDGGVWCEVWEEDTGGARVEL